MTSLGIRVALAAVAGLATRHGGRLRGDPRRRRRTAPARAATRGRRWRRARSQRTEVGAARVGDRIYVVGGYISTGGTTGRMVRYDISDDRWSEVAPLPIGVNHPGITAHDGRVYLLGGNLGDDEKSRRLYRYDPRRRPLEAARRRAHGARGDGARRDRRPPLRGRRLHGRRPHRPAARDLRRAGATAGRAGPKMPTGRNHVGAAVFKGGLVVTGGRPGPVHGGLATVERYDPAARPLDHAARPAHRPQRSRHASPSAAARRADRRLRRRGARRRDDDRAGRAVRPARRRLDGAARHGHPAPRRRRRGRRATASTRSRAARSRGSRTRRRSSTSTCPERAQQLGSCARLTLAGEARPRRVFGDAYHSSTNGPDRGGVDRGRTSAARPRR